MIFRRGKKEDIDQLVNLRIEFMESGGATFDMNGRKEIGSAIRTYYEEHLDKDCFPFVAVDGQALVGIAVLLVVLKPANLRFPSGRQGEVLNVYTKENYRGKGVATKLMHMLIAYGEQLKLDIIELNARPVAVGVYKEVGFEIKETDLTPMVYHINESRE